MRIRFNALVERDVNWVRWFAWYPRWVDVEDSQGAAELVWLCFVERRWCLTEPHWANDYSRGWYIYRAIVDATDRRLTSCNSDVIENCEKELVKCEALISNPYTKIGQTTVSNE